MQRGEEIGGEVIITTNILKRSFDPKKYFFEVSMLPCLYLRRWKSIDGKCDKNCNNQREMRVMWANKISRSNEKGAKEGKGWENASMAKEGEERAGRKGTCWRRKIL